MKIILVGPIHPYRGGIAHTTAMIAAHLVEQGHAVKVISFQRQYPAWLYPGVSDREGGQKQFPFAVEYLLDPLYPWTWIRAADVIRVFQPDLVLVDWWTPFWGLADSVLVRLLGRQGNRVAYLIHNVLPHEQRPWDRFLTRLALGRIRQFIVFSERQERAIKAFLPQAEVQRGVLPSFLDFALPAIPRTQARQQLNLPQEGKIALFFGIVRPYKGLKYLIEALALLKEQDQPIYLLVAGEFWQDEAAYRTQIEQLGLGKQVFLFNRYIPTEEVHLFFSAADVFVAPYVAGTQSGAVRMAFGFGLPVICTDRIADEDFPPYSTHIVPAEDAAALAAALAETFSAPVVREDTAALAEKSWQMLDAAIFALLAPENR